MMIRASLPLLLFLAGCSNTVERERPIVTTVQVPVAVAAPCVPATLGAAPAYPDTDEALVAAPDAAVRYQLMGAGRKVRIGRLNELETVVAGCPKESK